MAQSQGSRLGGIAYIDVHNHLFGRIPGRGAPEFDYRGAVKTAIASMEKFGIKKMLVMPPPLSPENANAFNFKAFVRTVKKHRGRFGFLAGGASLNVMIHKVSAGSVSSRDRAAFEKKAKDLVALGALGFGEMAIDHFSMSDRHIYESAPADHPLFLLLADIAARHGIPVDIHMEAIPSELPTPGHLRSKRNPKSFKPNIASFERLLTHNPKANIIWSRAGWDNTGERTPALIQDLLRRHTNLYMSLKVGRDSMPGTQPIQRGAGLKDPWRAVINEFPDRFLIGSDQFQVTPRAGTRFPHHMTPSRRLINFLSPDVAQKVGVENAKRLFKLGD